MPRGPRDRRSRPDRARPWRLGALVGLLVLLVAGDLPVVHAHDEPGLYDAKCPLDRLATGTPRASAPAGALAPEPLPVPEAPSSTVPVELAPAAVAPSAPRAPPVV